MADIDNNDLKKWRKALERLNRITKDFVRFRWREKSIVGDEAEVQLRGSRATADCLSSDALPQAFEDSTAV